MSDVIVSIEAAIAGGSISLIRDGGEIAHWIGTGNVSKAENLLGDIDRLLCEREIGRSQIRLIAVSGGPGSFTGIRIGIATALGLKAGLGVEMASVSALEAVVFVSGIQERVTAAVPMGRGSVCVQEFEIGEPSGLPHMVALDALANITGKLVIHGSLAEPMSNRPDVFDAGFNFANAVGRLAAVRRTVAKPLFVSKHSS
ncbi:MAG: tRNA (adenosine(37)-N6)-threonylcarbamoyltransferase complex dimerization subunit type 1 TsaB [Chloracidobacterium sp.]|nr:tRNA (adenosine(37)-N6)-threonylcarbamoyltransferase complex dimerization subunit type 1 TsaB [Chloracidobacterium sp.]